MSRRASEYVVGAASALIFLSAFAHAFPGWTQIGQGLQARVDPDLLGAVGVGWHFGSISMATFGLLGLVSVGQMRKGHLQARWTPVVIGAAYIVFGAAALTLRGPKPHFLAFILLGSLLLGGALAWSSER